MAKVTGATSGTENASPRRSQGPLARRQATVAELQRTWEGKLRSEGMPAEVRPLTSRHPGNTGDERGSVRSLTQGKRGIYGSWGGGNACLAEIQAAEVLADEPIARRWARFSQAAHDLPESWGKRKAWLLAYGEIGTLRGACRAVGIVREQPGAQPYKWLRQFAAWRLVNGC